MPVTFEEKRLELGLTQEAVAERVGVDRVSVTRWEGGICGPHPESYPLIAKALKVPVRQVRQWFPRKRRRQSSAA